MGLGNYKINNFFTMLTFIVVTNPIQVGFGEKIKMKICFSSTVRCYQVILLCHIEFLKLIEKYSRRNSDILSYFYGIPSISRQDLATLGQ